MSIFDTTLGERPIANNPVVVEALQVVLQEASHPTRTRPLVAPEIGMRPSGECPAMVDWDGVVLNVPTQTVLPTAIPPVPTFNSEEALAAIDAALRQNNARVAVNGLFDIDEG